MAVVASSIGMGGAFLQDLLAPMNHELGECLHTCGQPYRVELAEHGRSNKTDSWSIAWVAYCTNPLCLVQKAVGSYVPTVVSIAHTELETADYDELIELIVNLVKRSASLYRGELAKYAPRSTVCGSEFMATIGDWLTHHLREVGQTTPRSAEKAARLDQDFTANELFEAARRLGFIDYDGKMSLPAGHPWA